MNDLEQIEAIIAKNLTITDQRLMDGVIGAVMDAVAAEREACAKVCDGKVDAEYATGKVDHNEISWSQACAIAIRARDGEPETYCHTYYHIETGACIQHGEWSRTAGLGCPGCNGEIEKYKE